MLINKLFKEARRLKLAFGYSVEGLRAGLGESAFCLEVAVALIAIPLAIFISPDGSERAILIGSIFLVLIVELLNTAIETVVNRVSLEIHPLSKKAKDIGSAAVLLAVINAIAIWLVVLWR